MTKMHFANRAELTAAVASGLFTGEAVHLTVMHDDACTPERCTCEPEFIVEELTPETYAAGQRAQDDWKKITGS